MVLHGGMYIDTISLCYRDAIHYCKYLPFTIVIVIISLSPRPTPITLNHVSTVTPLYAVHAYFHYFAATFTRPEVEWKPSLEAELYGDQVLT